MKYVEREYKVLEIDVDKVTQTLEKLGAKKVFAGERIRTTFDFIDSSISAKNDELRLTEEDKLKLSYESMTEDGEITSVKVYVSRKGETVDLLAKLGIHPVAQIKCYRISYELDGVDYDLDTFKGIPAFLEIGLEDSDKEINEVLELLGLSDKEIVQMSTRELEARYKS
ncbi:CYTH domain-containing protein [Candidatus Dojkabacteria bacterium]|uniref:CYTH domain-containing protein n=1 Tax=Candidatus Dojkabacteria bacterium TaxID=2099670 RepID=A0A955L6A2_9BACT|nr:CYTH domain-containing protein [Candidatus Dojkabacteria bacterium]